MLCTNTWLSTLGLYIHRDSEIALISTTSNLERKRNTEDDKNLTKITFSASRDRVGRLEDKGL